MKKSSLLLIIQILSFFATIQGQTYELSADRHVGATGLNLYFNLSEVSSEELLYTKFGIGYNIIDNKYKYFKEGIYYNEESDYKIDYINLAFVGGLKYNYLLNLPSNIDIRTAVRANLFQGVFAELEGVYLIGETFGVILRGGYKISKIFSDEEKKSAESLGAFDGAFFGAAITF